ncbi:MAG: serine/threonine-protein kinase, partial [Acidobacteriota bacterium]
MTRASWRRVEAVFHAAAPLRGAARSRILDARCADDPDLRLAVDALLDTLDASTTFDEGAAGRLAAGMAAGSTPGPTADERPDARHEQLPEIGPYRLLRVLGEGGMGTVYLAEQGGPLARRVAIKIPRGGAAVSDDATRRFDLERKALARMSHPAIAQVFDAGTTETGHPFVVLEYVDGEPLTSYCDDRQLDLRRRVELFASICDGVAHAHAKAIIHCDLKPSNLLVTDSDDGPRAKIIDFGIAKALEPWSDSTALLLRAARGRAGSLRYMSPEALCFGSDLVETRSDVYSLGIVLCELLAGVRPEPAVPSGPPSRPFALPEASGPTRPSDLLGQLDATSRLQRARCRGLTPAALDRRLRSDLDWIVARATAVDAEERYGSVRELGDDLRRWLTDRPLEARPPNRLYRGGKFLRRHTALSAVAALLACVVIGFGLGSAWLYGRAEIARHQAESLVTYMLDDLSRQLEPIGRLALLDSVSRRSLAYFEARGGS